MLKAFRQGSIYFIGIAAVSLLQFVLIPVYARIFQPAEYGVLSLSLLLISIGATVVGNWLSSCVTRLLPYFRRTGEEHIFYATLLLSLTVSVGVFLLLAVPASLFFSDLFDTDYQKVLPLIVALVPLYVLFQVSLSTFRIKQQAKKYVASNLTFAFVGLGTGVLLAGFLNLGVAGILWGQVIILSLLGIMMLRGLFLSVSNVSLGATSPSTIKQFAKYGFPAAMSTVGTWLLAASDRYIIGYFKGAADVGLYSMGHNVGDLILLMAHAFSLAIVPSLMITYESDHQEATSRLLRELTRIFFLIGLPAVAGLSVLARPIVGLLTTEPYFAASKVVAFIALGNFIYGLALLSYTGLQTAMKSHIMARNWLLAGAVTIVLNIIFVPRFGYIAAAVITPVSYLTLLILNVKSSNKYLKWEVIPRTVFNVCLASLIMAGVVFLVIIPFDSFVIQCVAGVITGIVVYFGMVLVLKEFSRGEIIAVKSLVSNILSRIRHFN